MNLHVVSCVATSVHIRINHLSIILKFYALLDFLYLTYCHIRFQGGHIPGSLNVPFTGKAFFVGSFSIDLS